MDRPGSLKTARRAHPQRYIRLVDDNAETLDLGELADRGAHYAALIREGKRVTVTNRGEFVGYLVAADQPGSPFDRLVAAGQVRRATGHGIADLLPIPAPEPGEGSPVDELLRMRDEERYRSTSTRRRCSS